MRRSRRRQPARTSTTRAYDATPAPPTASSTIDGTVLSLVPLRNRRNGQVTRICEGMTEYSWDGKVGYGLSEYLDQIA